MGVEGRCRCWGEGVLRGGVCWGEGGVEGWCWGGGC